MSENIWTCKIGGPTDGLPFGADFPMRRAIERAYIEITGHEPQFIFSGWGGQLSEMERLVVNAKPMESKR